MERASGVLVSLLLLLLLLTAVSTGFAGEVIKSQLIEKREVHQCVHTNQP
jgi:hypothetical protein